MTSEQAIEELYSIRDFWLLPRHGDNGRAFEVREAVDMAVAALRARQEVEKNEPLTLEDLRGMVKRCEGVYVAKTDGSPLFRERRYCAAVLDVKPAFGSSVMHIQAIYGDKLTLWEDDYGKTWVAYSRPPVKEGT